MQHHVTVTMNNGREYECIASDTPTLAHMIGMVENANQTVMIPLEWNTGPGPQRRLKYHQVHVKVGHVSAIQARPSLWAGVRAMFLQEGQVWEIQKDALGTGSPDTDVLVRLDVIDGAELLISMVAVMGDGPMPEKPTMTVGVETFVETTSPASVDRLMDYGVVLSPGDTIGRWPSDDEMRKALYS